MEGEKEFLQKLFENVEVKKFYEDKMKEGFVIRVFDKHAYLFPQLTKRKTCNSYIPINGCIYCGSKSFRYRSSSHGKKYYQCENCWGVQG